MVGANHSFSAANKTVSKTGKLTGYGSEINALCPLRATPNHSPVRGPYVACEGVMVTPRDACEALYMVKFDRPFDGHQYGFRLTATGVPPNSPHPPSMYLGDPSTFPTQLQPQQGEQIPYYFSPADYEAMMRRGAVQPWLQFYLEQQLRPPPMPPQHSPSMLFNTHADAQGHRNRRGSSRDDNLGRNGSRGCEDRNRNDWLANGRKFYNNRRSDSLINVKDDASNDSCRSKASKRGFNSPNRKGSDSKDSSSSTIYRHQTPGRGPPHEGGDHNINNKRHNGHINSNGNRGRLNWQFSHHGSRAMNMYQMSLHGTPPDRFLKHAHLLEVTKAHSDLFRNQGPDPLSKSIWDMFMKNQQTGETYRRKVNLWRRLFIYIRNNFPKVGLYVVGSTMTGLGSESSDVDMCLLVRHSEMDQRNEAICLLGHVAYFLKQCDFVNSIHLIHAKVPILKFKGDGLEVDLNCNNSVGIRNTHLLYCYARMDWRVRPLVVVVKLWAAHHEINEAKYGTVSSYSWALMVIHFLQCGIDPPVLPCLQTMYQDHFSNDLEISQIEIHEELPEFKSENIQTLGELLIQFFKYYAAFDFLTDAISVRLGKKIPIEECRRVRNAKNDPTQWKYICIEEPFDQSNTARSVFEYGSFELVRNLFVKASLRLNTTSKLDSIFDLY